MVPAAVGDVTGALQQGALRGAVCVLELPADADHAAEAGIEAPPVPTFFAKFANALVADRAGLPRPPRITRAAAEAGAISPGLLSFMGESRRLVNVRMKTELGVRLRYPSVREGVPATVAS